MKLKIITQILTIIAVIHTGFVFSQESEQKTEMTNQQIFEQFEAQYGFIPNPILVLAESPGVVPAFMQYGTRLMMDGPLTIREFNLVTLSAAVAMKSPGCIQNQIRKLKKLGVSEEEIVQTVLIAGMLGNTSMLQDAYETLVAEGIIQ